MWKDRDKIINQPVGKTLTHLAIPAITSTLFTIIFEIVDMFWIGRLGTVSVAALSSASFFIWILRGLSHTIATGTLAVVSRTAGEKNKKDLLEIIPDAILSGFLFSLLVMGAALCFVPYIFYWLKLDPGVADSALEYSLVFLAGLVFVYLMILVEHIIRATGDTKTPMLITGISLLLNAVLDPIFIFNFKLGLKGAAYATIVSQFIGSLLMSYFLLKKIPELKTEFLLKKKQFFKKRFLKLANIGAPVALSEATFSFIYLILAGIISFFGKEPLAALGIGHRIEALPFFISMGFSMAVATMVGQNLGAGNIKKARDAVCLALKSACLVILVISIFFFLFAPFWYRIFSDDPAVIAHGVKYIKIIAVLEVFLGLEVVFAGVFSGAGHTRPYFFVVFPITFLRIPCSYFFAVTLGFGITAIWWTLSLTTFLKGIILFVVFTKGKWLKSRV